MKKLGIATGVILLAGILVATGWYIGFGHRFLTEAYAITAVDKDLTDASQKAMLLHQIDSGPGR